MYIAVTVIALGLIYGTQKVTSLRNLKSLRAYLDDFQNGVLNQSEQLEKSKRKQVWLWVALFLLLSASLVAGIITAFR